MSRNKLVVISRAGWIVVDDIRYFQDNDGLYLDGLARLFASVEIISQQFGSGLRYVPEYRYRFKSHNIQLTSGMEPWPVAKLHVWLPRLYATIGKLRQADVVYSFVNTVRGSVFLLIASLLFRKTTVAYCGTDRAALLAQSGAHGPGARMRLVLEDLAMQCADARIVTGPALLNRYSKLPRTFMAAPISAVINAHGVRNKRERGGRSPIVLLSVAHLHKLKNIDVLIQAVAILKTLGVDAILNVLGDGPERQALQRVAQVVGVSERVRFHGYIADPIEIGRHYMKSDIFLLASTVEGFPRAVWEAVYFGTYVIIARVGGVESIFSAEEMTILDEPHPALFAEAIRVSTTNPRARNKAVSLARKKFDGLFTADPTKQFERCLS